MELYAWGYDWVYRILLEALAVTLSKKARARAVQLPTWNEALGLPRPWDQQWSLRMQQILAFETDLLEYGDLFEGSRVVDEKVEQLKRMAREELKLIDDMGGTLAAIENAYMKRALVESNAIRVAGIESGERIVVGVNKWTEAEESPLTAGEGIVLAVDPRAEIDQVAGLKAWRDARDDGKAEAALASLRAAAKEGRNVMEPSIQCAHAGVTTGEWGAALREILGEYRAPTGVFGQAAAAVGTREIANLRTRAEEVSAKLGRRLKMLVGKPGLDGHSNGAEQIAVRARDAGIEVIYEGIRLTPEEICQAALEESVHVVGLSILSGSHIPLMEEFMFRMRDAGLADVPVVIGGIIPPEDERLLLEAGVKRVYTPKDFDLSAIVADIIEIVGGMPRRAA